MVGKEFEKFLKDREFSSPIIEGDARTEENIGLVAVLYEIAEKNLNYLAEVYRLMVTKRWV